jgi:predicted nicotinamide N-methyase
MQPTTPSTTEIRDLPPAASLVPPGLPVIPGGWTERAWTIAGREFRLTLPAAPDAFLDDPAVAAAHERDEYMPYWAYLWPASLAMSEAVLRRPWPAGAAVLELGAGVGLVGLAALAAGYRVTITDYDSVAVELALYNARRHGFDQARGEVLDWRQPAGERFPVLIGCELLYEDRNHELLLDVCRERLTDDGVAWFGDGGRVRAERFRRLAEQAGFRVRLFDEKLQPLPDLRVGQYQLLELSRQTAT